MTSGGISTMGTSGKRIGMVAALILGAACGSASMGGSATTTHASGTASTTRTTVATTGAGGGGGGGGGMGGSPVCNPPAAAGSFWAQTAQEYGDPDPTSMCDYRGDVLLVVNTADV